MDIEYSKIKNLFMRQSYLDAWDDYVRSLGTANFINWDYCILTASNEDQAEAFRTQIDHRKKERLLSPKTKYVVLSDPDGIRVGSGGATFNVLKYISEEEQSKDPFKNKRILVIHSGGDSKRVPQYSAVGKLFSSFPRQLPDGRGSTLFDEFIIALTGVASRIKEGMLVVSGDVMLLFNPLQIDSQFNGAAAISFKEPVDTGKDHGVFLNDGNGNVKNFLHKQTEQTLKDMGAVNEHGMVDLDTGAILMNTDLVNALFSLISTDGVCDEEKFSRFVNTKARISFYGDFLYPLAEASTLEQFYKEKPEGDYTDELKACRKEIWEAIHDYSLKLLSLAPSRFIHFGTTHELKDLVTDVSQNFEFLDWKKHIISTNDDNEDYSSYNSYVGSRAQIGRNSFIENSFILEESSVGEDCIVSGVKLKNENVPSGVVLHGLPFSDDRYVVRLYGINDNPKAIMEEGARFCGADLGQILSRNNINLTGIWDEGIEHSLWEAKLYTVCNTMEEAVEDALVLFKMTIGKADENEISRFLSKNRTSLAESFRRADMGRLIRFNEDLENRILSKNFIDELTKGVYYMDALDVFGKRGITEDIYKVLMEDASHSGFSQKIRIYYAVSGYMKKNFITFSGVGYDYPEGLCFKAISDMVYNSAMRHLPSSAEYYIARNEVEVKLPVRVNWGGGWTDTPPYCNECGGVVLNAAVSLNGILPVQVCIRRLTESHIEFESQDIGVKGRADSIEEIQDCHNPYDQFALHKAALIATGIVPLNDRNLSLQDILKELGGGIYISTQVVGIPKGSGLGTSSILAGACVKGLFKFLGIKKSDEEIFEIVLCMEQIMSTGGGWQDQVGGLINGIKLITTKPGADQHIEVTPVNVPQDAMKELGDRFALVFTGQRRLARNLLREVVGNYIGARPESVSALNDMKPIAALMRFYLERGDIDGFANELNKHWELSKQLDAGSTNSCIDQIFLSCEDLIDARFIAGAGGGGFIMVILKRGVSKSDLKDRLSAIFQDSGVDVWDCAFV